MTRPALYSVFGLTLRSDFALDALEPAADPDGPVDLEIRRTRGIIRHGPYIADPDLCIQPDVQYLHWMAVGGFLVESPDRILVEPYAGVSDQLVSQPLLGGVISMALERRRLLCLHAGAVAIDGRVAVLMGDKGAGKSTTGGALMRRGYRPVSDDLVPIEDRPDSDGPGLVRPGFASMKLYPDSAAALDMAPDASDRIIHPSTKKVQKRMPTEIAKDALPLGAVFVLDRSPDVAAPRADRLPPHEALQQILRHTFMARYGETRLGRDHLAGHMRRCGTLVPRTPVFMLRIPEDFGQLDATAQTIADTVAACAPAGAGAAAGNG
jgi:hypothetical protein